MRRISLGRRGAIVVTTAAALAAIGGVSVAIGAIPNEDGNIYACYSNGDGSMRAQADPTKPCAKGWTQLRWPASQPIIPTPRVYVKSTHVDVPANGFATPVLRCDAGDFALAGGYSHPTDTLSFAHVGDSFPVLTDGKPTAWEVDVDVDSSHTTSQPIDVYATCLDATP